MGNRAFVVFEESDKPDHGIYLHWNGGPESVFAFLKAMTERGWTRMDYASARFVGVVSEFFDSDGDCTGLSLGIMGFNPSKPEDSDPGDNGIYYVSADPLGGFQVKHRGTKIRMPFDKKLTEERDVKQYHGIVERLSQTRALRIEAAKKEAEKSG